MPKFFFPNKLLFLRFRDLGRLNCCNILQESKGFLKLNLAFAITFLDFQRSIVVILFQTCRVFNNVIRFLVKAEDSKADKRQRHNKVGKLGPGVKIVLSLLSLWSYSLALLSSQFFARAEQIYSLGSSKIHESTSFSLCKPCPLAIQSFFASYMGLSRPGQNKA